MSFSIEKIRDFSDTITASGNNPNPPANAVVGISLPGLAREVAIQLEGVFVATVQFEVSIDGGKTWSPLAMTPSGGGAAVQNANAPGLFVADVRAYAMVQARCSAYTSGAVAVVIHVG
ncbi:MAG TPA: hypothetical protein VFA29_07835 [Candidatus Baltobacteraceae bacterium]|nr:hypothetical protein [Candidatus Baltobacteraceae bacterium]